MDVPMTMMACWCGTPFSLPTRLYRSGVDAGHTVYCPHGHKNTWRETEADKLRRERDRLKQWQARLEDEARIEREAREAAERSAAAHKGQATRLRKRAKARYTWASGPETW